MQMCLLYTLFQLESLACQDLYQHVSHLDKQAFRGEIFQINRHDVMTYHPPPTLEGGPRRPFGHRTLLRGGAPTSAQLQLNLTVGPLLHQLHFVFALELGSFSGLNHISLLEALEPVSENVTFWLQCPE